MSQGIEGRHPFLDRRVAAAAARLEVGGGLGRGKQKQVLRAYVREVIDPDLAQAGKHGFAFPVDALYAGPLCPLAEDLLTSRRARERGFVDPEAAQRVLHDHVTGRPLARIRPPRPRHARALGPTRPRPRVRRLTSRQRGATGTIVANQVAGPGRTRATTSSDEAGGVEVEVELAVGEVVDGEDAVGVGDPGGFVGVLGRGTLGSGGGPARRGAHGDTRERDAVGVLDDEQEPQAALERDRDRRGDRRRGSPPPPPPTRAPGRGRTPRRGPRAGPPGARRRRRRRSRSGGPWRRPRGRSPPRAPAPPPAPPGRRPGPRACARGRPRARRRRLRAPDRPSHPRAPLRRRRRPGSPRDRGVRAASRARPRRSSRPPRGASRSSPPRPRRAGTWR